MNRYRVVVELNQRWEFTLDAPTTETARTDGIANMSPGNMTYENMTINAELVGEFDG